MNEIESIKDLLRAAGLTQSALARRFDIPLRTVQHWCAGDRDCPPYVLGMMAELLNDVIRNKYE